MPTRDIFQRATTAVLDPVGTSRRVVSTPKGPREVLCEVYAPVVKTAARHPILLAIVLVAGFAAVAGAAPLVKFEELTAFETVTDTSRNIYWSVIVPVASFIGLGFAIMAVKDKDPTYFKLIAILGVVLMAGPQVIAKFKAAGEGQAGFLVADE